MTSTTPTTVEDVVDLFSTLGHVHYGEDVTQLDHALQCAALAVAAHAPDALVAAALLHDVGHLVADVQGESRVDLEAHDDDHEAVGARVLAKVFGPAVAGPVALHVTAKRWRCTVEPDYHDTLSATSKATLVAQGGLLDEVACRRFEAHPAFEDALALRTFDDHGKVEGMAVAPLEAYRPLLEQLARTRPEA
jgi:predicted HD phosphohydrolase